MSSRELRQKEKHPRLHKSSKVEVFHASHGVPRAHRRRRGHTKRETISSFALALSTQKQLHLTQNIRKERVGVFLCAGW